MRGMGYLSTWTDVLDENGNKMPKCNKDKEIIYNKDGSVRYLQKPDKQGIIDWIEDQKNWIHREMLTRYGWEREYKGSHPRGNLSTPDYRAARAAERLQEFERKIQQIQAEFDAHIEEQICKLDSSVDTDAPGETGDFQKDGRRSSKGRNCKIKSRWEEVDLPGAFGSLNADVFRQFYFQKIPCIAFLYRKSFRASLSPVL